MEGSVVTDPVPAVEELEITSAATTGSGPVEPTTSDSSGGGDGIAASYAWSLTHKQQVRNLKLNWLHVYNQSGILFLSENKFETDPWFSNVVSQLRGDPCLEIHEFQMDYRLVGGNVRGIMMTSLDLAILMGDLKMVQKILEISSLPNEVIQGWFVDLTKVLDYVPHALGGITAKKTGFLFTPLHLAVVGRDSYIVDALLEKGVDVNAQNWLTETPSNFACQMGSRDMLLKLLKKDEEEGKDPLHVAVRNGDIGFMKELPHNINALDNMSRTPLHYLASKPYGINVLTNIVKYLDKDGTLDVKALDCYGFSAFYVAVLCCNTKFVIALLDSAKDHIRLNEVYNANLGPPIQIAFQGGHAFRDIERALMECDPIKGYMERLYRDRQVYVDAANAILVGAALIASVTFASWLQPPLNYTSYFGAGYSSSITAPSSSDLNYVDVEHNIALRAFWIFNALSFYFAIATVVCGARSVLPRSHLFIKKTVEKLRTNLLVTSMLLACSVLFVIIALQ